MSQLLGEALGERPQSPYDGSQVSEKIRELLRRGGFVDPFPVRDSLSLHRWIYRNGLLMFEQTYLRLLEPFPTPPSTPEFLSRLPEPPAELDQFSQGRIDPESCCRRAEVIHQVQRGSGPVLFLGDDDAASVALSLLGAYELWAADLDQRVLGWLARSGAELHLRALDVRDFPAELKGRFAAVVVDPVRDGVLGGAFLRAAHSALKPEGSLFWADHPDWNPEFSRLQRLVNRLKLKPVKTWNCLHSYKAVYKNDSTAEALDLDPGWLRRMAASIRMWSHLYQLSRS